MSAVDAAAPTYIEELFNMSPYLMLIQKSIYLQFFAAYLKICTHNFEILSRPIGPYCKSFHNAQLISQ